MIPGATVDGRTFVSGVGRAGADSIRGHALPGVADFTAVVCRPTLSGYVLLIFDGHRASVVAGRGGLEGA